MSRAGGAQWTVVLDEYEHRLVAVRDATAAGNPAAVPPFVPPAELGPMPDDVVPRARELLLRSREVEHLIKQARDVIGKRLATPPQRASRPARGAASRLDVSV